ncbi:MAG: hydantoinase/oxoprolinase family protein [Deltaproteobacteria bacterium]
MILGIDVGGTHTDAVLIEDLKVKKKMKTRTNEKNLIDSLLCVTSELLRGENLEKLKRIVLSTTISTNAIVQNKADRVSLILVSGPGLPPSLLTINEDTHFVSGYVNHRGIEITEIDQNEVSKISTLFKEKGIQHVGIVGKFSTRNPDQEIMIDEIIRDGFRHVSLGHRMSGHLNFPRRISTTYLNAAIWELYNDFVRQVLNFVNQWGFEVPIYILKADGGTIDITQSVELPVQTILSGPAASIMGIMSMFDRREDAIAIDIGGTTTDIAIFADGSPLLEVVGVTINGHKTLIRGLHTKSIGLGGDSRVKLQNNQITIGPEREGPAAAFGGPCPTPTDAMIVLGMTEIGDKERAVQSVMDIAAKMNGSVTDTARVIIDHMCRQIVSQINGMIEEINNKPVYTIYEMFEVKKLKPVALYVVGGPAHSISGILGELLGCPAYVPEHAEVANAIGAALARTTAELTLLADTERGTLIIGQEGVQTAIPSTFTKDDALRIGIKTLKEKALKLGAKEEDLEIEVIEDQEFNMVREYYTTGKNIRLKVQVKPGLIAGYKRGNGIC